MRIDRLLATFMAAALTASCGAPPPDSTGASQAPPAPLEASKEEAMPVEAVTDDAEGDGAEAEPAALKEPPAPSRRAESKPMVIPASPDAPGYKGKGSLGGHAGPATRDGVKAARMVVASEEKVSDKPAYEPELAGLLGDEGGGSAEDKKEGVLRLLTTKDTGTLTFDGVEEDLDEEVSDHFGGGDDQMLRKTDRLEVARVQDEIDPLRFQAPETTLPRMFYFENTYLGGSAAYRERLRRLDSALREDERPYRLAYSQSPSLDAPTQAGLEVSAQLDTPFYEQPRRVYLQVGLRGSPRYGWRRPPLDVMLVVDRAALATPALVSDFLVDLVRRLDPADRVGVVIAGAGEALVAMRLTRLKSAKGELASQLDALTAMSEHTSTGAGVAAALRAAGGVLAEASKQDAIVPGTQTVLLVTRGPGTDGRAISAERATHELTVQGAVTSVFAADTGRDGGAWWRVANAGHGNFHRLQAAATGSVIDEELQSLARVVARLVRVNIRLGKNAKAIRVLGTRVLEDAEVRRVKAREVATDRNLSQSMGITSDRGDDDDGIQTVIPYFYGDDSHVIIVELWVTGPGPVADVTVRYKDMVNLTNATGRTSARLDPGTRPETEEALVVARNVRSMQLAELLQRTSHRVRQGDLSSAMRGLSRASSLARTTSADDQRLVQELEGLVQGLGSGSSAAAPRRRAVGDALMMAGERKVGLSVNVE